MKNHCIVLCVLACAANQAIAAASASPFKSKQEEVSYGIGVNVARNFQYQEMDVDQAMLVKGIKDALDGNKLLVPERELRPVMNAYQTELRQKQAVSRRNAAIVNGEKSRAFLDANKSKEGVQTLASGVQYKIVKAGEGRKPTDSDTVECNYRGTLIDGTEFDASEPDHAASFKLANLIPGWKEALKLMPVGSKWKIFVPPERAYGERGVGHDIGPNQTLVFDVDLVAIK
jgi:FKBP-type peptidyl-prolyl cis-trans isomerase